MPRTRHSHGSAHGFAHRPAAGPAVGAALCGLACALIAGPVFGQTAAETPDPQESPAIESTDLPDFSPLADPLSDAPIRRESATPGAGPADQAATIASRIERADGSVSGSVGQRLPAAWETKVGVDFGLAPTSETLPPLPGQSVQDRGTGWANVAVPGDAWGEAVWDKAVIDARVDPAEDQGTLSTLLSRSVPVGGGVSLTVQNGYAVTQSLANPGGIPAPGFSRVVSGDGAVRLELPTATALSAGAQMSSTDDKVLRRLSAEQQLFGLPLSITGAISERSTGDVDKSVKAGFKRTW
jgi:hypothetical protein